MAHGFRYAKTLQYVELTAGTDSVCEEIDAEDKKKLSEHKLATFERETMFCAGTGVDEKGLGRVSYFAPCISRDFTSSEPGGFCFCLRVV